MCDKPIVLILRRIGNMVKGELVRDMGSVLGTHSVNPLKLDSCDLRSAHHFTTSTETGEYSTTLAVTLPRIAFFTPCFP